MARADSEVTNRGVDVNSRPRQSRYARGSFSDRMGSHQGRHHRSLDQSFDAGILSVWIPVKPAFDLVSLRRISDPTELTFGRP